MPRGAKYGGRTKGTPNKKTVEAISRAEKILQLIEAEYFEEDIKAISSAQRITLYSDMLEYVAPKLSRAEITGKMKTTIRIIEGAE
jgi:hypothetical protein